jgi:hypothetical protein
LFLLDRNLSRDFIGISIFDFVPIAAPASTQHQSGSLRLSHGGGCWSTPSRSGPLSKKAPWLLKRFSTHRSLLRLPPTKFVRNPHCVYPVGKGKVVIFRTNSTMHTGGSTRSVLIGARWKADNRTKRSAERRRGASIEASCFVADRHRAFGRRGQSWDSALINRTLEPNLRRNAGGEMRPFLSTKK